MKPLELKHLPASCLRKKTTAITAITNEVRTMLDAMAKIMYTSGGVGLAAPQVGIDQQLAVIDIGEGLIKMINPVIVKRNGTESQEEGCLSVPEAVVAVKRAAAITVSFLDEEGNVKQLHATGLLARAIQHEIDHLQGKLIVDHAHPLKRLIVTARAARTEATRKRRKT